MNATEDRLVDEYLRELSKELTDLPSSSRREVVDEIEEHIAEARASAARDDETAVRNILDRLGEPAVIAEEARERFGLRRRPAEAREIAALVLLLIGGLIVPGIGWLVGVVLLWVSDAWTTREKWLGTLVIPGGLGASLFLGAVVLLGSPTTVCTGGFDPRTGRPPTETCTGGASDLEQAAFAVLLVLLVAAPIAVIVFLARRMRRPAQTVSA